MKLPKTTILLLIAAILFFIGIMILLFRNSQQINQQNAGESINNQNFTITKSQIASSSAELKEVTDPLILTFSFPLKLEDIVISVVPPTVINMEASPDQKQVTITPASTWNYGTKYTIKILKSTQSKGQELDKDYTYQFETKPYRGI